MPVVGKRKVLVKLFQKLADLKAEPLKNVFAENQKERSSKFMPKGHKERTPINKVKKYQAILA